MQLGPDIAPVPAAASAAAPPRAGWRPPGRLPDPALLAYTANALTILALAIALLKLARRTL